MRVLLYSAQSCPHCQMAKAFLKWKKVKFSEIDVSKDSSAELEMVEKSGQRLVPQIDIDGVVLVGFNPAALEAALIFNR